MKKATLLSITAMASLVTLVGCGEKGTESGTASPAASTAASAVPTAAAAKVDPFTMTVRHIHIRDTTKPSLKLLEEVVKKTETDVPGLKFTLDGVEDTVNRNVKLKAEMANGTQPAIFNLFGGADTVNYSKAGRLLALNDIMAEAGIKDSFFDLREFTVDGKIYGLPESGYIEGFFYNKKLFEQAGVQVPKTWNDLMSAMEQLKAKGITPIAMGSGGGDGWVANMLVNSLMVGLGGPALQEGFTTGATKWTDPAVIETFKRIDDLAKKKYIDPNVLGKAFAEGQATFYTGKAAMLFDGSWAVNAIVGDTSVVKDSTGFFRMPDVGGAGDGFINGGWSNGYGFSAALKPNELTAVKAFVKNFYTLENQKRTLVETNQIPAMKGVKDVQGASDLIKTIGEQQGSAKGAYPAFDAFVQPSVKVALETTVQELLGGKIQPEAAAQRMQKTQESANASGK
ncbi:ABC transporter substrate-binding protein [Paenibacillus pectinilyticus]|uniref:ABC transporter substrate-binding protein n=1 Tax=Paenibacillus pectinilyticus TaxID=512399 RepID=A0A1C1A6Z0_9BACL|nr:extracellular solute-binding protein [Paenibacillus pectinilyticus]OCT16316.1 ABC transporter substrate-binding protein [Paenibacillus pectinilyticus]